MDQIFMIEAFVKKIILKIVPPEKDEYELRLEAEERRKEAEALAAAEAAKKGKKGKPPKPKKEKKGKAPPMPSEEEMKFLQSCTLQINCQPVFEFYVAHDNFIPPPPPAPPAKGKKKPPKPKKGKKAAAVKLVLPSEPLPEPPYFGVGNSIIFLSRPDKLEEELRKTPMHISVWNRDEKMNCIGYCIAKWDESFFECLQTATALNPMNMDQGEYRKTSKPEFVSNSVEFIRSLICEDDLTPSGEIEFFIRLTCMGNKIVSCFVTLPEMERLPGRKFVTDDVKSVDIEIVRHWEGTTIDAVPPVAYLFCAPEITRDPILPVEEENVYEEFVAPYTASELEILAMGYPKRICPGLACPTKQYIQEEVAKKKHNHLRFVKEDYHGPCGKINCPSKNVPQYICDEGIYKTCRKPCVLAKNLLPEK